VITDLIPSPLIKQLKAGGRMVIPDRWRVFSGNKPRDNRLLVHLRVLFSLLAQENSPDEVSGLQSFLCPSEGKKQRQDSELKPHAGVFGYQREVCPDLHKGPTP
jgi:hypothetical protein